MNKQLNYRLDKFYEAINNEDKQAQIKFWSYVSNTIGYSKQEIIDSLLDDSAKGKDVTVYLQSLSNIDEESIKNSDGTL